MNYDQEKLKGIISKLDEIREYAKKMEQHFSKVLDQVHPEYKVSAQNLIQYIALRNFDNREMQRYLTSVGISSFGRCESHVLATLKAVQTLLFILTDCKDCRFDETPFTIEEGRQYLNEHTEALLGPEPKERRVRIMVTLASDAANDYDQVKNLFSSGMNCVRINCVHDEPATWQKMIHNVRKAADEMNIDCKIIMDLGGPKLRTGPLKNYPGVIKIRPQKSVNGKLLFPAKVFIGNAPVEQNTLHIPVKESFIDQVEEDDVFVLEDARGKKRTISVLKKEESGVWGEVYKTTYLEEDTKLYLQNFERKKSFSLTVGPVAPYEIPITLIPGDTLIIHKQSIAGEPAKRDKDGNVIEPAHISCSLPEVFTDVKPGEKLRLDDGKIAGLIKKVTEDEIEVKVVYAKQSGSKLRSDKGINFPDSNISIRGLTTKDIEDLDFVVKYADIVSMSFVNDPGDILDLQEELRKRNAENLGILLKIETNRGFYNLPLLILTAMKYHPIGFMIARGDLAVECGWKRLAEIQEEILWLCEAAHIPGVWATQVLESLAKDGIPSRAEISDAAMAQRADCVMLNKGPHIMDAIKMLDGILRRMQDHQLKKASMLRRLKVTDVLSVNNS